MIYKVQARIKQDKSEEFYKLLRDGSLKDQSPDGPEILVSMDRATVDLSGLVRWTEACYCPTPLRHERATVYDKYFSDLETEETDSYDNFDGEPFLKYLSEL